RLNAETIEYGAKDLIVVEAIDESFAPGHFIGHGSVHYALVEVSGAQSPRLAGEHDVVTIVHFREMVKGAGLLGIRYGVSSPIVLDGDVAFFNIDIGSAIFTHGAELDEVTIGLKLSQCEEQVERAHDVIHLSENGVFTVNHGIGSGALFGKMDDSFRFKVLDD